VSYPWPGNANRRSFAIFPISSRQWQDSSFPVSTQTRFDRGENLGPVAVLHRHDEGKTELLAVRAIEIAQPRQLLGGAPILCISAMVTARFRIIVTGNSKCSEAH